MLTTFHRFFFNENLLSSLFKVCFDVVIFSWRVLFLSGIRCGILTEVFTDEAAVFSTFVEVAFSCLIQPSNILIVLFYPGFITPIIPCYRWIYSFFIRFSFRFVIIRFLNTIGYNILVFESLLFIIFERNGAVILFMRWFNLFIIFLMAAMLAIAIIWPSQRFFLHYFIINTETGTFIASRILILFGSWA